MELKFGSKLKVVLKRGNDPTLLTEALQILMAGDPLDIRSVSTLYQAAKMDTGNATFKLTGF